MARSAGFESEARSRIIVGYTLLVLLPPVLALAVLAAKFQGLQTVEALDHAQLARHLAAGEGFVTSFIRPLSLVFKARYENHPDLYNAPAHPLVVALFFRLTHPSDRIAAGAGAALWLLSVWLTFGIARRWLGTALAFLATFLYVCNVPALGAALGALPQPLMALSVLLAVGLAFPRLQGESAGSAPGAPWLWGLAGVGCAVATLSHYLLVSVPLVLGVYLAFSHRSQRSALGWFVGGFLGPLFPWMVRQVLLVKSPFFTLFWYEFLANTPNHPGETIWRTLSPPLHPFFFLVEHPFSVLRKVAGNLNLFRENALNTVDPVVGLLFLAALLSGQGSPRERALRWVVAISMGVSLFASCFLRPDPRLLLAWEPLLVILGVAHLGEWISDQIGDLSVGRWIVDRRWTQGVVYLAVLGLVGFPLVSFMLFSPSPPPSNVPDQVAALKPLVPSQATVVTDQPAFVAWYAERRAVWLCLRTEDWEAMQRAVGPVEATYITPAVTQIPPEERGDIAFWLYAPGRYGDLVPVPAENSPPVGVLKVRTHGE